MAGRVVIGNKEIRNPFVRLLVGILGIMIAGLVVAGVLFLVLPIVGVVVTFSVGLVGVLLICLGVALPILILGGMLFGVVAMPFSIFKRSKKKYQKTYTANSNTTVHLQGDKGEQVNIGPDGIHIVDGDSEVKVNWSGVHIKEGKKKDEI